MQATEFSERPYFPFFLGNGKDVMLMNYGGAMITGTTGHTHNEQNQGVVCGWHKVTHKKFLKRQQIQPIIIAGYNVIIGGEVCEPLGFVQEFNVREATLVTQVSFRKGVKVSVEAFLSDNGVLSLTVKVLEAVSGMKIAFLLLPPNWCAGTLTYFTMPDVKHISVAEGIDFTYRIDDGGVVEGSGLMRLSRPGFEPFSGMGVGVQYGDVENGWEATAWISCEDAPGKPVTDYTGLREKHIEAWKKYYQTSDVRLPEEEMQYAAGLARYVLRANQFATGSFPAGPMPYHWGGGTCCPFDAELMQHAMLQSGNFDEAFKHVMFYVNQYEAGEKIVSELGLKGVAFSNWSDVFGNHKSGDLKYELTKRKPIMIAIIGMVGGNFNNITGKRSEEARKLALGCAEFIKSGFVRDGKIVSLMAGNESDVKVERDSWMLAASYRCFRFAQQEDPGNSEWKQLAENMLVELRKNISKDGVLMPYQDAEYTAGTMLWVQYFVPDMCSGKEALINARKPMTTPWGLDADQPSEVYRDWPWNHCLLAKSFAEAKCPQEAFKHLKQWFRYASSNGACPEKLRLDGYAIGYWYTTPYAVFLLALYAAFAYIGQDGRLCLLYGFDGTWQDLSIQGLRLPGGICVSLTVQKGEVIQLDITGEVAGIDLNPAYKLR